MSVRKLGENTQVAPELQIPCPARLGEIGLTCAVSINRRLRTLSHLDYRSGDNPKVSREKSIFSRAYAEASPEERAALRVWMMRDIILPGNGGHNDFAKSLETREESVAVLDRRILVHFRAMLAGLGSLRMPDNQCRLPWRDPYFAFTSMGPEDAGCSAVAGCPDTWRQLPGRSWRDTRASGRRSLATFLPGRNFRLWAANMRVFQRGYYCKRVTVRGV